ncbi:MAG: PEP-CTERM sorting domain-containing protein [Fimbriimonadaceae bacterium]
MKKLLITSMALAAFSAVTNAVVLWDQSTGADGGTIVSQEFSDFPDFSTWTTDDVRVNDLGWDITRVVFFGTETGLSSANTSVNLYGGSAPNSLSLLGTGTQVGNDLVFTFAPGSVIVGPGGMWMGATVSRSFGAGGQWFANTRQPVTGSEAMVWNPGGGFGLGTDPVPISALTGVPADLQFIVEGEKIVPEPASIIALAAGGLALLRRRAKKA